MNQASTSVEMIQQLLPGRIRVGVGIYDQARGRTYRAVKDGKMVVYLKDVTPPQLQRLWRLVEQTLKDEKQWRK